MKFRKLRIAWSALCGVACMLLIVLWVRSYWWSDVVGFNNRYIFVGTPIRYCESVCGMLQIAWDDPFGEYSLSWLGYTPFTIEEMYGDYDLVDAAWKFSIGKECISIGAPHWLVLLITLGMGIIPWLPRRFSLRTLLITTTLVAVVLGVAVYVARK